MKNHSTRVMLAAEHPEVRYFLKGVVESQDKAVIVGQAENANRALMLAKNLRPDVALIDCHLPHIFGNDMLPLSRVGGLDTAQAISEEVPGTRIILLNSLDHNALSDMSLTSEVMALLSGNGMGVALPASPSGLVFASVAARTRVNFRQRLSETSDKVILFSGLGILGGLGMMLTIILAGAGMFVTAAGAAGILAGLAGKLAVSLWSDKNRI
ncbi:MAG: response regulator [Chloroflexi bacterium]|nr:response regulator [Chloroflexota bacterium]